MNTTFVHSTGHLELHRWPLNQPNNSLQAWDAADELLIEHAQIAIDVFYNEYAKRPTVLIINDSFGALACALTNAILVQVNDSFLAAKATLFNREQNALGNENFTQIDSLSNYPDKPDIVLLKLPNNHSYLQFSLQQLVKVVTEKTLILASAKAKDIHRNVLAMFSNTLGPTSASLTIKKCRLITSKFDPSAFSKAIEFPLLWPLEDSSFTMVNHANVFSREKLDQGARFFLKHLPQVKDNQRVIDLGCGNGILSLYILNNNDDLQLVCCDESYMAVESAKRSIEHNLPDKLQKCEFITDDCLSSQEDKSADIIICNPPFHQQQTVTTHIANQMFTDAKRVLRQGGYLRIVANRHLNYYDVLKRLFGHCRQLAADSKFVILEATKRN